VLPIIWLIFLLQNFGGNEIQLRLDKIDGKLREQAEEHVEAAQEKEFEQEEQ
jgi:hypothetical protein